MDKLFVKNDRIVRKRRVPLSRGVLGAGIALAVCFPPWPLLRPCPPPSLSHLSGQSPSGHGHGREGHSRLSGAGGPVGPQASRSLPLLHVFCFYFQSLDPSSLPPGTTAVPASTLLFRFPKDSPSLQGSPPPSPESPQCHPLLPVPHGHTGPKRTFRLQSYVPLTFSKLYWNSVIKQTSTHSLSAHTKMVT